MIRAALLLATVLGVLFPRLVFSGHVLYERDVHQMLYGQYASFARATLAGSWPVWDPWLGFGQPMLANPGAQTLYPPTWLCLLLPPGLTYTVFVFLHLLAGALGVRALAVQLGVSATAALGAALVFMLSGPVLSLVNLWHHLAGACLMPGVVWAAERARLAPGLRSAIVWGGAMGLQALAGSFDMCALTAGVSVAFWARGLLARGGRGQAAADFRASAPFALAALTLALGLAAPLLFPALDLVRNSARAALPESVRAFWSLHPALLAQTVLPLFPQRLALAPETRALLFDGREPFLASIYLGLSALPLAAAAFRRRREAIFLSASFGAAALLALGRYAVAYPALIALVPPLRSLRYPVKITVVMALAFALLVGLGLDALREPLTQRTRASLLALGGAAVLAALVVASRVFVSPPSRLAALPLLLAALFGAATLVVLLRSKVPVAQLLVLLAGLDLLTAHRSLHPTAPAALFARPPAVLEHLEGAENVRLHAWDYMNTILGKPYRREEPRIPRADAPPGVPSSLATARARHDFLSPPVAARFGFASSFDRDWLGLQPRGVRNLGLQFQSSEETPGLYRLLRLGGVTHVVALHREGLEELDPLTTEKSAFAGPVHLLRVRDPRPRSYAVGGTRVADGLPALQLLTSPAFDPEREIVIPSGAALASPPGFSAEVRETERRPDRVRLEASLSASGHLVALEAWDPGWRGRVDGRDAPVVRANVGFLAVAVSAGHHTVELFYWPERLTLGLVSCLAAVVLGTLGLIATRKQGRASGTNG